MVMIKEIKCKICHDAGQIWTSGSREECEDQGCVVISEGDYATTLVKCPVC